MAFSINSVSTILKRYEAQATDEESGVKVGKAAYAELGGLSNTDPEESSFAEGDTIEFPKTKEDMQEVCIIRRFNGRQLGCFAVLVTHKNGETSEKLLYISTLRKRVREYVKERGSDKYVPREGEKYSHSDKDSEVYKGIMRCSTLQQVADFLMGKTLIVDKIDEFDNAPVYKNVEGESRPQIVGVQKGRVYKFKLATKEG